MKYFIAKSFCKDDDYVLKNARVVIAATKDDAVEQYYKFAGECEDEELLVCQEVYHGSIGLTLCTDKFRVQYPESASGITVRNKKDNSLISGILIAEIPASVSLTEAQILEFFYRGNIERYNEAILAAETDERVRINLRKLRQAIPYARLVIDTGNRNVAVPLTPDFVVES